VQVVQVLPVQCVPVAQPGHCTFPLPQALATVPQVELVHSGGAGLHTPPMHCCPVGQLQFLEFPQASMTLPQRFVLVSGVHVSVPHDAEASTVLWGTQALPMHALPLGQPPQLIGTPQGSTPTMPHRPVHDGLAWHDWDPPALTQTWPPGHALPQTKALPVQGST
jgi:hypothetical protein